MPRPGLQERRVFVADDEVAPVDKNQQLAALLNATWIGLMVVSIQRIEIGSQRGWLAIYRV